MTAGEQDRERLPETVWWLLGAFGVLVVVTLFYGLPRQQEELADRAAAAVAETGLGVSVSVEGRDAYVTGRVGTYEESESAAAAVAEVEGVRFVHADVAYLSRGGGPDDSEDSVGAVLAADPNPALSLQFSPTLLVVRGRYPDDGTAAELLAATAAAVGDRPVRDELVVSAVVQPTTWIDRVPPMLGELGDLTDATVSFGIDVAVVSGEVPSEEAKDRIGAILESAVGDVVVVTNNLEVVPPTPLEFHAAGAEGQVILAGLLPDEETIVAVADAAVSAYGEGNVTNLLEVGAKVEDPPWLDALADIVAATRGLDSWSFDITATGAAFSARGPDDASIELVAAPVGELTAVGLEVASDVERSAASIATELTGILEGSATFASGSTRLSAEATELLDEAVVVLVANPSARLTIEGHTDDVGRDSVNLELSQARAEAVVAYLVAAGVGEERLVAIGFGETAPIADNDTDTGRAANRRIVFVVREDDS